jgi:Na+-transporting NADH:ubiquinone oxidoreductase subunit NqrF
MKASELFGVVVRATGFLIIIYSLWNVWAGFDNVFENILQANQGSDAETPSSISYFVFGVPGLVLGAILFFLADWVVKLAYRNPS